MQVRYKAYMNIMKAARIEMQPKEKSLWRKANAPQSTFWVCISSLELKKDTRTNIKFARRDCCYVNTIEIRGSKASLMSIVVLRCCANKFQNWYFHGRQQHLLPIPLRCCAIKDGDGEKPTQ